MGAFGAVRSAFVDHAQVAECGGRHRIPQIGPRLGRCDRYEVDETHHDLADGTMIHVGIYRGTLRAMPTTPISQFSFGEGWRRIVGVAP